MNEFNDIKIQITSSVGHYDMWPIDDKVKKIKKKYMRRLLLL